MQASYIVKIKNASLCDDSVSVCKKVVLLYVAAHSAICVAPDVPA